MKKDEKHQLYVAGVGASAGGLDALSKLLGTFNGQGKGNHLAVVIAQHMNPDYKSELTSILARRCKWPVITAENNLKLEPRKVYVAPSNTTIEISGGKILLSQLPENYLSAPSIDNFLMSLARDFKDHAIGVIFSGFGHDGTKGLKQIKVNGGLTLAQKPDTAQHPDMPLSAINEDIVDITAAPERIFEEIVNYVTNHVVVRSAPLKEQSKDAIIDLLAKKSGTDFSHYKPSTILRRMDKRLQALQLKSLADYHTYISTTPQELDVLFSTVLIGVTEFFREPLAFEAVGELLKKLIANKEGGDSIRIWSVGCATGEEIYSLAITLLELLGADKNKFSIYFFASDIDEKAIATARRGLYTESSMVNMPSDLLEKYFDKIDGQYEVRKELKQFILFSRHDITADPPFVKIDLIACRNLLIYFNNSLQKQALQVMHYALNRHGLLFLGKSDSVSAANDLFSRIDKNKIFRKEDVPHSFDMKFSRVKSRDENGAKKISDYPGARQMSLSEVVKETLYTHPYHPFVVINETGEIKEVQGSLRLYLEVGSGSINNNITKMVNNELLLDLKSLMVTARKTGKSAESSVIRFNLFDTDHLVRLRVIPFLHPASDIQHSIVVFEEIDAKTYYPATTELKSNDELSSLRIKELEQEIDVLREHLQSFTEELETSNEELQSLNEELQSANEELKSANEELETGNEELQSANEELHTANNELRISNEMLILKEDELKRSKEEVVKNEVLYRTLSENVPNGTIGVLNEKFQIEYVAGRGLETHGLTLIDLKGKTLPDLNPSEKERVKLRKAFSETIKGRPQKLEYTYHNHRYSLQTIPLSFQSNGHKRLMYLSQDITKEKRQEEKFQTAIKSADLIIYEYNIKTGKFSYDDSFPKIFEITDKKNLTRQFLLSLFHPDDLAQRNMRYEEALSTGLLNYEARLLLPSGVKWIRVFGTILFDEDEAPDSIIASIMDITRDKRLLEQVQESEQRFKNIADSVPVMIRMVNENRTNLYLNRAWLKYTGRDMEDNTHPHWEEDIHPKDAPGFKKAFDDAFDKKKPYTTEYRLKRYDGQYRWVESTGVPRFAIDGRFEGFISAIVDLHEIKTSQKDKDHFIQVASHELKTPITVIKAYIQILKSIIINDQKDVLEQLQSGDLMKTVDRQIERLTGLVTDLLDVSKIESGKMVFHMKKFDIYSMVSETVNDFKQISPHEIIFDSKGSCLVYGDSERLSQVVINLLTNASKYSPMEKEIVVKMDCTADEVRMDVTDFGIGIEKKDYEKIFERFFRSDQEETNTHPGLGIGLFISKEIVARHDGSLDVQSQMGEKTVFTLRLPRSKD